MDRWENERWGFSERGAEMGWGDSFLLNMLPFVLFCFWDRVLLCHPGWSVVAWSWLTAQCNLQLLNSSDSHASAFRVAETTGVCHYVWLIFAFFVETEFHHVGYAGLKLLISGDLPASISQSVWIIGVSHHAWPGVFHFDILHLFFKRWSLAMLPRPVSNLASSNPPASAFQSARITHMSCCAWLTFYSCRKYHSYHICISSKLQMHNKFSIHWRKKLLDLQSNSNW